MTVTVLFSKIKRNIALQYFTSFGLVCSVALTCSLFVGIIGYKVVALILLLVVSMLAMVFDILPVLASAVLSSLIWNFFFIPPLYNFSISNPEDVLLFLMYFVIALMNGVLTSKIRKAEEETRNQKEKENAIKLYNTVLNSLSHELKTPISTIIGVVDTLKESFNLSEGHKRELLSEADVAVSRLNRQVENLLNMSRIESGFIKPKLDWCDLNELVHSAIHGVQPYHASHPIYFKAVEDISLYKIDGGLLEQALSNILINAVQHTPENTEISIWIEPEKDKFTIIIKDTGPGIPADKIDFVFEKFYRLPGASTGGTGLGLSIVKGFIEASEGTVELTSVLGHGTQFIITIPAKSADTKDIGYE